MKNIFIAIFFCIAAAYASIVINADDLEFDANDYKLELGPFDIQGFVTKLGYPFEKHSVTTKDGYILEIHRVQYSPTNKDTKSRPPVLVMHGLLGSSADFFHIGVGKSLPLRLADIGYDVWVGNNRGNTWGSNHQTLIPSVNASFWDFGLDELGNYDSPAIIDYILNATATQQLSLVGHSTGASQFFIMAASMPEYNKKVKVLTALAPIVYINHTSSIVLDLVNKNDYTAILALEKKMKLNAFLTHDFIIDVALGMVCKVGSKFIDICAAVLFLLQGFDPKELNKEMIPQFFKTFPAGTSVKELNHFLQIRISGQFRQFDYGIIQNLDKYGQRTPPVYNISKVSIPVGIFHGQNDLIVTKPHIDRLASDLPNVVDNYQIQYPQFNHLDFLLATDVDSLANVYIINTLNTYNGFPQISTTTTTTTTTHITQEPSGGSTTQDTPTTTASSSLVAPSCFLVAVQLLIGIFLSIGVQF